LTQDNIPDPNDPNDTLKRQLLISDITPVAGTKDRKKTDELRRLIAQVRSVKVQSQEPVPEPVAAPKIAPALEPNDVSIVATESAARKVPNYEPNLPYKPISAETLKILGNFSHNPHQINNPLELGELLFRNGNYKEAVLFYREALVRTEPNNPDTAIDRAWILFQTGNCLRNSDMPGAAEMYGRLITEFPNSLWAQMSMVQSRFITWYQKDEPQKLITDSNLNKYKD
jgi:tetratricopeptide (TPR) repeat protein